MLRSIGKQSGESVQLLVVDVALRPYSPPVKRRAVTASVGRSGGAARQAGRGEGGDVERRRDEVAMLSWRRAGRVDQQAAAAASTHLRHRLRRQRRTGNGRSHHTRAFTRSVNSP